jgi:hypothetical protein
MICKWGSKRDVTAKDDAIISDKEGINCQAVKVKISARLLLESTRRPLDSASLELTFFSNALNALENYLIFFWVLIIIPSKFI